jgi:Tfp pilus assembly protein PilO
VKKMTKNTRIALIVVGLVLYAAGGWFLLVSKQGAKATELKAQIAETETRIIAARAASRRVVKIEPVKVADLFRLSKAMPDTTDMPGVLLELNRIARDSGITFESITPQVTGAGAGYTAVPIDVVFEGNFYDLADFLYRTRTLVGVRDGALDARGRLFNVQTLAFSESTEQFPQIRAALRVEAYVFGTDAAAAGAAAAPPTTAPPAPPEGGATDTTTTDPVTPPPAAETPPSGEGATAMGATP